MKKLAYRNDPIMAAAWLSACQVGFERPEIRALFEADRGRPLSSPPKTPIEAMIDQATGAARAEAEEFVEWFNREVWGEDPFADECSFAERLAKQVVLESGDTQP